MIEHYIQKCCCHFPWLVRMLIIVLEKLACDNYLPTLLDGGGGFNTCTQTLFFECLSTSVCSLL